MWAQWAEWSYHWLPQFFCGFFEKIHDPLKAIHSPLGPHVSSWDTLGASRKPTFHLCEYNGQNGQTIGFPFYCQFFETIHDPLKATHSPLWQNVNSWDDLGASREPKFPFSMTCVSTKGRMGIPLASVIFCGFF